MEKYLIKKEADLRQAKEYFCQMTDWSEEIEEAIKDVKTPFFLIGSYSEDVEFGARYDFGTVSITEFKT